MTLCNFLVYLCFRTNLIDISCVILTVDQNEKKRFRVNNVLYCITAHISPIYKYESGFLLS